MLQFDKDVQKWKDYDFVVINDDFEKCCKEILYLLSTFSYHSLKAFINDSSTGTSCF